MKWEKVRHVPCVVIIHIIHNADAVEGLASGQPSFILLELPTKALLRTQVLARLYVPTDSSLSIFLPSFSNSIMNAVVRASGAIIAATSC